MDEKLIKRVLSVLRPSAALSRANARFLAEDLRKCATWCDEWASSGGDNLQRARAKRKRVNTFDFSRYQQRSIALRLFYIGWPYHGFASQQGEPNTIEAHLFQALEKTCLIPRKARWHDVGYTRCGRTDVGVSALAQVVTVRVRSSATANDGSLPSPTDELDYPRMLNRVLPGDIQVTGWAPAPPTFSARFNATYREYKYFIAGVRDLDVEAMQQAATSFEGEHDFRNFCKMDLKNCTNHVRRVLATNLSTLAHDSDVACFTVRGTAFLWHQIRYMVAVLLMVGRGREEASVVSKLLDCTQRAAKPSYTMADEAPLLLYATAFSSSGRERERGHGAVCARSGDDDGDSDELQFKLSAAAAGPLIGKVDSTAARAAERLALLRAVRDGVLRAAGASGGPSADVGALCNVTELRGHTYVADRGTRPTVAEHL